MNRGTAGGRLPPHGQAPGWAQRRTLDRERKEPLQLFSCCRACSQGLPSVSAHVTLRQALGSADCSHPPCRDKETEAQRREVPCLRPHSRERVELAFEPKESGLLSLAQLVKNPPAVQETWVRALGREDPLEKEMATHSRVLAWRIPWTEEPGGLHPWGHKHRT